MPSTLTDTDLAKAKHTFYGRMLATALHHRTHIDARTVTIIQKNGFMERSKPTSESGLTPELLKNPKHAERDAVPAGPMVYRIVRAAETQYFAVEVMDALLNPATALREAALDYLEQCAASDDFVMTARSRQLLQHCRNDIVGQDETKWRTGALLVSDALADDLLWSLAGLKQALAKGFEEAALKYAKAVFQPSVASVGSIDLGIWQPSSQRSEIERLLIDIGKQSNIQEICRNFYLKLGHIPLHGTLGLAKPIHEWLVRGGHSDEVWGQVWDWADKTLSPLARYHACLLFIECPNLMPANAKERLFVEVAQIIAIAPTDGTAVGWAALLQRRSILARHYLDHFSCQLPGGNSERTTVLSWWLSDRVEMALAAGQALSGKLTEKVFSPAVHWSRIGVELARPREEYSDFAYATSNMTSPWALSLQCQLAGRCPTIADTQLLTKWRTALQDNLATTVPHIVPTTLVDPIGAGIAASTLAMFPATEKDSARRVYGFDGGVSPIAEEWSDITSDDSTRKFLAFAAQARQANADSNSIIADLRVVAQSAEREQIFFLGVLKSRLLQGLLPMDSLWSLLNDPEWRDKVFGKLAPSGLELLFDSLTSLPVQTDERWRTHLPHVLAVACESTKDVDRQRLLFAYTILICIATGTDGAIRRLLGGPERQKLLPEVDFWRNQLRNAIPNVTPWVVCKIRPVLAALHIP